MLSYQKMPIVTAPKILDSLSSLIPTKPNTKKEETLESLQYSYNKPLVQKLPQSRVVGERRMILQAGPLPINRYNINEMLVLEEEMDMGSEFDVKRVQSLPTFIYKYNKENGKLTRNLVQDDSDFKYYNTDPDYGISQQWLLFNRQGDEQDRLPERRPYPDIAEKENNSEQVTTLDRGRVWHYPPKSVPVQISKYNEEYERLLEYGRMVEEDDS